MGFFLRMGERHLSGQKSLILAVLSLVTDILPAPYRMVYELNTFSGAQRVEMGVYCLPCCSLHKFLGVPVFIAEVLV